MMTHMVRSKRTSAIKMDLKISKDKAQWNKSSFGNSKKVVIVEFPNCSFKWLPTYKQLEDIKQALNEIEQESWNQDEQNTI
jgi:hypothetical protein